MSLLKVQSPKMLEARDKRLARPPLTLKRGWTSVTRTNR